MSRHLGRLHLAVAAVLTMALAMALAGSACAAVVNVGPSGFELKQTIHIAGPADKVYAALIQPKLWWDSGHTFSGSAANLTLDARAGGCFCEALPDGGSVQHEVVVLAAPGKTLAMRGALGPFQGRGVDGALAFALAPAAGGGVDLIMTNDLGGYMSEGFADWAPRADAMLADQMARLKHYLETGKPEG
jgi:uncharacterized protein YndB with AHSA1/START domain